MPALHVRRLSTVGATIALAAAGLVAPATSAFAATPTLTVEPATPAAGQSFKVTVKELTPTSSYRLALTNGGASDVNDKADSNSCTTLAAAATATTTCTLSEATAGAYSLKLINATGGTEATAAVTVAGVVSEKAPKLNDNPGAANDSITVYKTDNVSWKVGGVDVVFGSTDTYKDVAVDHQARQSTDVEIVATATNGHVFADGKTTHTGTVRVAAATTVPAPLTVAAPTAADPVGTKDDTLTFTKVADVKWTINGTDVNFGDGNTVTVPVSGTRDADGKITLTIVATATGDKTFGDGAITKTFTQGFTNVAADPSIVRVAGDDRFATAVEVAKKYFPGQHDTVYVANGLRFPDALAAGPAAALGQPKDKSPLLLSAGNSIGQNVLDEIRRMQPKNIIVVGGSAVVSDGVVAELGKIATVTRRHGADRFATAVEVSANGWTSSEVVYLANGMNFPDALSGGSGAAAEKAPLLLSTTTGLSDRTIVELRRLKPKKIVLVGGERVLSTAVAKAVGDAVSGVEVVRAAGADRYATSALILENATIEKDATGRKDQTTAFLATGRNYPDALAGIPAASLLNAPLALTLPGCLPASVKTQLDKLPLTSTVRLGSSGIVGDFSLKNACS